MRVSDLVKDLIFLVGSVECFAQVGRWERGEARVVPGVARDRWLLARGGRHTQNHRITE